MKKKSKDNLLRKIIKNSGIILFGNIGVSGLNFITFAIMAKQLGPEALAILVLAQTYSMIINDVFNVQTWESMIKFGSTNEKNSGIGNVIKTNLVIDIVSAFIACTFAMLLIYPAEIIMNWDDGTTKIVLLYSISILFNITTLTIGIPRLFNKFAIVAKIQLMVALFKILIIINLVNYKNELYFYIMAYLFTDILASISLIIFSISTLNTFHEHWWKKKISLDKQHIRFIWWTNLRTIIRIPVRRFDIVLISFFMPLKMVGIYKVYKEIAEILNRLSDPINQAIFPEFTKLIGNNDIEKSISIAKKTMLLLFPISLLLTTAFLLCTKPLVTLFFGAEYMLHLNALYSLIILYGFAFFITPINALFIAAGFAKYSFFVVLFTNSIYLTIAFFLVKLIGFYGIIIALATQMVFNPGLKAIIMKKFPKDWNTTIR